VHVGFSGGSPEVPDLSGDLAKVAAQVKAVGAEYVVAPMFKAPPEQKLVALPGEDLAAVIRRVAGSMTADHWKQLAERLNTIGAALKREGLEFGYHNHNVEFAPHGEITGWDILLTGTDPGLVVFELDVGWVSAAGLNPAEVLSRHRGRYRLMHVKDLKASTKPNFLLTMDPTEVGSGRIDWSTVLTAARDAGVREYFVEQEPPFERDRMEAARISFDYLAAKTRA
jgi:sugar phosphate isomerase/epimerase